MATQAEKEHLVEVLKFTPRTYKVRLWGYGGEYVMGTVDRKAYNYFKNRRLDLSEFAWDSDYADANNIPEDMQPFYPGNWHECEDMGHCWGVDRSAGTIQVDDENGDTVYEKNLDDITGMGTDGEPPEPEWMGGDEIWIDSKPAGTAVFVGVSSEKGTFFEGDIELTTPFNPGKISLTYDEIDGNEIITGIQYDGVDVENWGGDTTGKGSDFGMYIAGSNKQDGKGYEKYRNMDDIEYTMTEWFPKKIEPVRNGVYMVKTAGKNSYTHQAKWTGTRWISTWQEDGSGTEEVKIKEWQGIAYDPDEQDLRDELTNIVIDLETMDSNLNPWAQTNSEPTEPKTLTYWTIKPLDKKSIEEVEHFTKDGMEVVHTTGWRWGEWTVATNDGNPPELEFVDGRVDVNNSYGNNIEEIEMVETSDGWLDDTEWPDDIDPDERTKIEEAMDEDGYYSALEENDWWHSDTEMYISGPIEITDANGEVVKVVNE